jgi:hypothetical protein
MTLIEPDPPLAGGTGYRPAANGRQGGRRWWLLLVGLFVAAAIVLVLMARAYQPLGPGAATSGGLPGQPRPAHARQVNTFGAQNGELFIPPQRGMIGVSVSLGNWGRYAVTIEAVSMSPPGTDLPWPLVPAGPVRYWTSAMFGGLRPQAGRPIVGLSLKPGQGNDIYVGIPVRTSSCYIPGGFTILDSFYVKERFLAFTKWVRVPLLQPLLLNAPADPPNQPGPGTACAALSNPAPGEPPRPA